MADDKKPDAKPAPAPSVDPFVEIVWMILVFILGIYLLNAIVAWVLRVLEGETTLSGALGKIQYALTHLIEDTFFVRIFLAFVSMVILVFIIYLWREINALKQVEHNLLYPARSKDVKAVNPHWQRIEDHIASLNENDWRLGIIEGDIMLSGLLETLSLPGDTMGEKLKAVEKSDFTTIDNAWEAHKVRNQIAHEGTSFKLSHHEAKRIIELYRSVFEEFKII